MSAWFKKRVFNKNLIIMDLEKLQLAVFCHRRNSNISKIQNIYLTHNLRILFFKVAINCKKTS